jgi:hypothetical protein
MTKGLPVADYAFVNERTGRKYRVIKFDPAAGKVVLSGEHGVQFEEKYDKELFVRLGYKLVAA